MDLRLHPILTAFFCTLGLAGTAVAQGSDNCATATAISGVGTFSVVTTSATTSTQQPGTCPTIFRDVWFAWTATANGSILVSLCGGASVDTVAAVYNGSSCPASGSEIACNDDSCNLQSNVGFPATGGNTYMIQIGTFDGSGFNGTFTISTVAPCSPITGPDVIVGDIGDIANYTAAGGIDAISLGTESCDPGQTWVNWFQNTPQHPVIGGNLYRYHVVNGAGRFEQIGQSWLKHAFFALSELLCCPVCFGTDGTHLGVGCADTYTAGRNGTQGGLGPRWQVNATTGVFAYPPANPGFSGAVARRLEFLTSDIDTSAGSHYYGEAQYVTQDDAQAGNGNNNASYRALTVSGSASNWNFALSGSTVRMTSAIRAWQTVDAAVVEQNVQVDGLFVVAYRTTSLGGGQFHYEYAVYNMNSDRACGSFSIPVGPGVTITNIGFHDVDYRDGDGQGNVNQTGTDWVGTVAGGAITWACQTQAQNNNANAIRWGTTYNFRFDANVAPANGTATLGLWKSGSPAAATTTADVPGVGSTSFAFCPGDGTGTACPCGNNSTPGGNAGCLNSLGTGGSLTTSGTPSISADTFVLSGSAMPNSSALYFQGTAQQSGGAGSVFGDGLRCASGTVIRLGTKVNAGGSSQYPQGGDLSVSVKGADSAGDVRTYQVWYRNAAAFCQPETFNLTNGWQATWLP